MIYLGNDTCGIIKHSYVSNKMIKCILIFNNISLCEYKNIVFHYINYIYQYKNIENINTYIILPFITRGIHKIKNVLELYNFILNINNTGKITYDIIYTSLLPFQSNNDEDVITLIFDKSNNDDNNINDYKQLQTINPNTWIFNNKITNNKIIKTDYNNFKELFEHNIFNMTCILGQHECNNKIYENNNIIILKRKQTNILNVRYILTMISHICYCNIHNNILKQIITYCIKQVQMNYEKSHIFKCYEHNVKHVLCADNKLTLPVEHLLKKIVLKANYNCYLNYDIENILIKNKLTDKILQQISNIDEDNVIIQRSCDFFTSVMTLSNWVDELRNNSIMCLLANIGTKESLRKGIILHSPNIKAIATYFFPLNDYLTMLDNKTIEFLCINRTKIITDTTIGTYNIIIPIYINKIHWTVTKIYLNTLFGIILGDNPLICSNKYSNILYTFLIKFTCNMMTQNNIVISDNLVRCYITLLRTCFELAIENKYSRGMDNYIKYLITEYEHNNTTFNIDIALGQILAIGYNGNNIIDLILCINKMVDTHYKDNKSNVDITIQSFIKMKNILMIIRSDYGSYNKFIKDLDINHGYLSDQCTSKISKLIKEKQIIDIKLVDV